MLFCSWQFCVFFAIVFSAYWLLPWPRARVYLLLIASFVFYAAWSKWLALLIGVSTVLDYLVGLGLEATARPRLRKLLLGLSLTANLGLLFFFKYANFFLHALTEAAGLFGLEFALPVLKILAPIGISFYTFEAINYVVDVYYRRIRAARDLSHFMLFILFFPHLIAGPIVRARDFLPLIARRKHWSWLRAGAGVQLILLGVIKKLAVADRLALYVDPVFADPGAFGSWAVWQTAAAYAVQVYCDFSGYSDMACGLAHLFGYHLARNFNLPLLSRNQTEFWRRWHISLSIWIRDYLYIPLGGSRKGTWRTYRNLFLTLAAAGLWHGAGWGYLLFGVLQGFLVSGHKLFAGWCERRPRLKRALETGAGTAARVLLTFVVFCASLVIFRAPSLAATGIMLARLAMPTAGADMTLPAAGLWLTLAGVLVGHLVAVRKGLWAWLTERLPAPVWGGGFAAAVTLTLLLAPHSSKAFIYFQF
jgi:alginate O-acetyltransferase complex protein AlgI